jgi:predicted outer membrane repeat protein
VIGAGTPASCTFDKLASAVATGGIITFNCGDAVASIAVTATLALKTDRNTIIDGGHKIILDGGGAVRILSWNHGDYQVNDKGLTLQRIELVNGKASATERIPTCPSPCSQGYNDGEGGALYMRDGVLRVIDATFANNQAAELGPDTGGGAIYVLGAKPAYIAGSTFQNNKASNAGAVGFLQTGIFIYNSLFEGNSAVGNGANNDDASKCSCINNGQHEIGSGGNGGAIYNDGVQYNDGAPNDVTICGTQLRNNSSNAFGAGVFYTSNDGSGTIHIQDCLMSKNASRDEAGVWEWKPGISTNANTPDPINSVITK